MSHPYYNALALFTQGSYLKLKQLHARGSWEDAWREVAQEEKRIPDPEQEYEKLGKSGIRLILSEDTDFPPLLKEIPHPPFGIYVRGALPEKSLLLVAIVGTRKATDQGKELARDFAKALARAGIGIVSGLALGIDGAAHGGALTANGWTGAVLAHGLDTIYPRTHSHLGTTIVTTNGALISEYPMGSSPLPYRFLERNRIVSGLSRGVVFIETPKRSGALATARFALDQNRDIFVLPGPARHPHYGGSHELIRRGGELVTSAEEILGSLGLREHSAQTLFENPEEEKIIELIKKHEHPLSVDKIIELTNLKPKIVNQAISLLIIKNAIQETNAGFTA